MRRAGHRVLVDARAGREEARDEVVAGRVARGWSRSRRARPTRAQRREVGRERAHVRLAIRPRRDSRTGSGRRSAARRRAPRAAPGGASARLLGRGREVELDPVAGAVGASAGRSACGSAPARRRRGARLPEHVRAGERRVAAEVDLDGRREPAQREAVVALRRGTRSPRGSSRARRAASTRSSRGAGRAGRPRRGCRANGRSVKASTWVIRRPTTTKSVATKVLRVQS